MNYLSDEQEDPLNPNRSVDSRGGGRIGPAWGSPAAPTTPPAPLEQRSPGVWNQPMDKSGVESRGGLGMAPPPPAPPPMQQSESGQPAGGGEMWNQPLSKGPEQVMHDPGMGQSSPPMGGGPRPSPQAQRQPGQWPRPQMGGGQQMGQRPQQQQQQQPARRRPYYGEQNQQQPQ